MVRVGRNAMYEVEMEVPDMKTKPLSIECIFLALGFSLPALLASVSSRQPIRASVLSTEFSKYTCPDRLSGRD